MITLNLTIEEAELIKAAFGEQKLSVEQATNDQAWGNVLALYSKAVHALEIEAEREELEAMTQNQGYVETKGHYRGDYFQDDDQELWDN